jgi:hypothetical protein
MDWDGNTSSIIDPNIPQGQERQNRVSGLFSYGNNYFGSFSGADIKVVVHLPKNPSIIKKKENDLLNLSKEYDNLKKQREKILSGKEPNSQKQLKDIQSIDAAMQANTDQVFLLDEQLARFQGASSTIELGEIQTLSYSVFREKAPVRTLGSVYPRAYVRGSRTIAGTMVFTVFHKHAFHEILQYNLGLINTGAYDHDAFRYSTNMVDQLPPLDISLIFANEYGAISYMGIYGVEFVQEGSTFSIEDIYSENVIQYVARDLDPMRQIEVKELDDHGVMDEPKTASSILYEKQNFNKELDARRNPFI